MKKIILLYLLFSACIAYIFAQTSKEKLFDLTINIEKFEQLTGKLYIAVYNKKEDFRKEDKIYKYQILPIHETKKTIIFKNLPKGIYAISTYHDVNENGKLDTNFWGIPKEPYGFSNNPRIFMGPPSFVESHIVLAADQQIHIVLK
ncbi:MAG: DUF2141 domain-containing protein [Aureispira sp.]|nr:DUF2141 domain-containing protein [Aureispira sp.]